VVFTSISSQILFVDSKGLLLTFPGLAHWGSVRLVKSTVIDLAGLAGLLTFKTLGLARREEKLVLKYCDF
jgi:hypothetical protein